VSEAGLSGTNGSGKLQKWTVDWDEGYLEDRATLEAAYPRLSSVFDAVDGQFSVVPDVKARRLATEAWLYVTPDGFGTPALMIYYEIHVQEKLVYLLSAHRAGPH